MGRSQVVTLSAELFERSVAFRTLAAARAAAFFELLLVGAGGFSLPSAKAKKTTKKRSGGGHQCGAPGSGQRTLLTREQQLENARLQQVLALVSAWASGFGDRYPALPAGRAALEQRGFAFASGVAPRRRRDGGGGVRVAGAVGGGGRQDSDRGGAGTAAASSSAVPAQQQQDHHHRHRQEDEEDEEDEDDEETRRRQSVRLTLIAQVERTTPEIVDAVDEMERVFELLVPSLDTFNRVFGDGDVRERVVGSALRDGGGDRAGVHTVKKATENEGGDRVDMKRNSSEMGDEDENANVDDDRGGGGGGGVGWKAGGGDRNDNCDSDDDEDGVEWEDVVVTNDGVDRVGGGHDGRGPRDRGEGGGSKCDKGDGRIDDDRNGDNDNCDHHYNGSAYNDNDSDDVDPSSDAASADEDELGASDEVIDSDGDAALSRLDMNQLVQAYGLGSAAYELTIEIPTAAGLCEQSSDNEVLFRHVSDGVLRIRKRFLPLVSDWRRQLEVVEVVESVGRTSTTRSLNPTTTHRHDMRREHHPVVLSHNHNDDDQSRGLAQRLDALQRRLELAVSKWEDLVAESDKQRLAAVAPSIVSLPLTASDLREPRRRRRQEPPVQDSEDSSKRRRVVLRDWRIP